MQLTRLAVAAGAAAALYAYYRSTRKRRVVITGGCGNLGTKLAKRLLEAGWEVTLLEHPNYIPSEPKVPGATIVPGDLTDGTGAWTGALRGADSLVHFSAVNPYPNANWEESAASMAHASNVFLAATRAGVRRVVFASSNHVMGGYKDRPELGPVRPTSPPRCGTRLNNPEDAEKSGDAVAYAAAKLAGEELAKALAANSRTTFAILRIGWCQPGANLPTTLNPAGCPPEFQTKTAPGGGGGGGAEGGAAAAGESVDEAWFKNMWLSNRDFLQYFEAALDAPTPVRAPLLVNAMSRNAGMRWTLEETERALSVTPLDDSRR